MKKIAILTSLIFVLLTTIACQEAALLDRSLLAAGTVIPETLPAQIQDPILQQAWVALYNQDEVIPLWDGMSTSGRQLAQFVLDRKTPVVWGSANICNGYSCTGQDGTVYITPAFQHATPGDLPRVVSDLAHEIFHSMLPFGQIEDTLYEEFWAFYTGMRVTGTNGLEFKNYDPLNGACLSLWFGENNLSSYRERYDPYPASVAALADGKALNCPLGFSTGP